MVNAIGTICSYSFVNKREGEDVTWRCEYGSIAVGGESRSGRMRWDMLPRPFQATSTRTAMYGGSICHMRHDSTTDDQKDSAAERSRLYLMVGRCL